MAKGGGFAGAAAAGIMGYIKGMQLQQGMDRDAEDRAAREEERNYQRGERARAQDERRQLADAARPVTVEQGAGGVTLPATADNRDVGQPDGPSIDNGQLQAGYRVGGVAHATQAGAEKAAADANSADGVAARQVSVLRALGRPTEAAQLESANLQGKAAKFTLDREQEKWANEKFDQRLGQIGTAGELAEHASTLTGKDVSVVTSQDGKKAQLVYLNDKGEQVKYGSEFDNSAEGVSRQAVGMSKSMGMAQKVAALQHFAQFDEQKKQNEWSRKHGDDTLAATERHYRATEGQAASSLGLQRESLQLQRDKFDADLKNDPTRNMPGGTKLVVGSLRDTIKMYDSAISKAMAEGTWDPKSPGATDLLAKRNQSQRKLEELAGPYMGKDGTTPAAGAKPSYDQLMNNGGQPATRNPVPGPAPAPAPAGRVITAAQQAPTAVSAAPAAPAAPARDPLLAALNPSGNASLDALAQQRAAPLREAADALRAAQAEVVGAAQGGGNVGQATARAQAALDAIDKLTADMEPGMAKRVRQAAGLM
jgi:hypothetical protein